MSDNIPQWAKERAATLVNVFEVKRGGRRWRADASGYSSFDAFAHYIAEHEQPPIDPLLLEARKVAATVFRQTSGAVTYWHGLADRVESGNNDDSPDVQIPLAALRRGIELGREQS